LYKYSSVNNYGPSFTQLDLSDIPLVHSKGITGDDVIIGLLDTGYDWQRHISLNTRNVLAEYDFVFNDTITANQTGDHPSQHDHGTLIFSIIGGYHDSTMIGAAFNSSLPACKNRRYKK
jgi:serine protease AprX